MRLNSYEYCSGHLHNSYIYIYYFHTKNRKNEIKYLHSVLGPLDGSSKHYAPFEGLRRGEREAVLGTECTE